MIARRIACSIVGLLFLSAPLYAGPVTWEFSGEITRVLDEDNVFAGTVFVGSTLTGTFTFESTTPDSQPHPASGVYNNSIINLVAEAGALSIAGPKPGSEVAPNRILVNNATQPFSSDLYAINIPVTVLGYQSFRLSFVAVDNTATVFNNDSLPLLPPAFSPEEIQFHLVDSSETLHVAVDGHLTLIRFVPEPSTLCIAIGGTLILLLRRPGGPSPLEMGESMIDG